MRCKRGKAVRRDGPKASEDDADDASTMMISRLPQPSQRQPPLFGADGDILLSCIWRVCVGGR